MSWHPKRGNVGGRLASLILLAAAAGTGCLYAQDGTKRVSEADLRKAAVSKVAPEFPPLARQLRISGHAELDVFVSAQGTVEKVEPKSGNAMFTSAAATALKKWKFTPFKSDGKTVKAVGTIRIDFSAP
jgi:TonB family protein